jgi:hypothetical protein
MPSCYPRSALAMLLGPSCGNINISLGKSLTSPTVAPRPLIWYLATIFPGLLLAYAFCYVWSCCFPSGCYWPVRTNGAMRSLQTIRMMMYTSRGSTRREIVLRSRSPRLVSVLIGKHKLLADVIARTGVLGFDGSTKSRLQICSVISACCAIIGKS